MPNIARILAGLNSSRTALDAALAQVPSELWQQRPRPEAWSAAEVVAHLTMVEEKILDGISRSLRKPPVHLPLWKRLHVPPWVVRWRLSRARTPLPLDTSLVAPKDVMLARFAAARRATLALLEENRNKNLSAYRGPHPLLGSLNYYDWFRMICHHEVRHTKQIREIVASLRK